MRSAECGMKGSDELLVMKVLFEAMRDMFGIKLGKMSSLVGRNCTIKDGMPFLSWASPKVDSITEL